MPCGMFDTNTAVTNATLIPPPPFNVMPRMNASGDTVEEGTDEHRRARTRRCVGGVDVLAVAAAALVDEPVADVVSERPDEHGDERAQTVLQVRRRDQFVGDGADQRAGAEAHDQPGARFRRSIGPANA